MTVFHPATPSGYTIFCDDVRHEITGKQILIGVYNADLVVESLPALLPSFNFVIHYRERKNESELPVKIVITVPTPDDQPILEMDIPREGFKQAPPPPDAIEGEMLSAVNMTSSVAGLLLTHIGRIKVRAYRGDDEIRLGTLRIRLRSEWEEELRKQASAMKEAAN
jgi:hypothetical protein